MQKSSVNTAILQSTNQNSITNKLCKFFKNLLELEKDQGRLEESVAIIQRYINKEINVDELGNQLKGNASRAQLPESLMSSLKSNIDDLRREMFFGRVKIDRINPPPESVIIMNPSSTNVVVTNNLVSAVNARLSASQFNRQNIYSPQANINTKPAQQIVRQTVPTSVVQTRPIGNSTTPTAQVTLTVPNASLRPLGPAIQTLPNNNRTVSIPTSALINVKPMVKSEEPKITPVSVAEPQKEAEVAPPTNVPLSTTILNPTIYRTKVNEAIKTESGRVNISEEALNYISEAIEKFSTSLLEQAAAFACHRQEVFTTDPMYKKIDDVRSQLKYLQDYDDYQRASEEERHKAELFKAAKSRSKVDNQEQQKLKETVRKIQEYDKNCDEYSRANMTALKAIGNKRKIFDQEEGVGSTTMAGLARPGVRPMVGRAPGFGGDAGVGGQLFRAQQQQQQGLGPGTKQVRAVATMGRQRNKRIILKDFQLVLDQDAKLRRFKTYKKIFMFGRY